ncbi:MAG: tetratricopeptide repeat protein [Candidatus Methylomirabilota bacterium]
MIRRWTTARAGMACLLVAALVVGCAGMAAFDTVESLMREGQALYLEKKYDEAAVKFEQVLLKESTYWMAYLSIARCYIAKGDWLPAIANARKAFQLSPSGVDVVTVFGESLFGGGLDAFKKGQFSDAVQHFVEYIRVKPSDPKGYLSAGRAYLGNGAFGEALRSFMQGFGQAGGGEARQELIQGLLDGGLAALSNGSARDAIGFLQQYLQHDTANLSALLGLGKAYWQSGEMLQALGAFRRALELSPGNDEAQRLLRGLLR